MNGSSVQPERAWRMAFDQLHMELPKAAFDTWVNKTSFVSFEDGVFTVGTINPYGREWLANRPTLPYQRNFVATLSGEIGVDLL